MKKLRSKKKEVSLTLEQKIKKVLVGYVSTQFVLMVIVGVATWGVLNLLNVEYAVLLGILTGVLSSIPNFGIAIATIAITLVTIFDKVSLWPNSPPIVEGLLVIVIFVLLNKIVDLVLAPLFLGKTNKVSPVLVFLLTLFGTILYGVPGAILAVPVYLVIKTVIEHFDGK